jgi:hypothetical protein
MATMTTSSRPFCRCQFATNKAGFEMRLSHKDQRSAFTTNFNCTIPTWNMSFFFDVMEHEFGLEEKK